VKPLVARIRRLVVTGFLSATLVGAMGVPAGAQVEQDGLVNVNIGDITIEDVNVGVAAAIAANVCGVKVGPVAVLGVAVDRSGDMRTVCEIAGQDVTLTQN
jgi:hypothetical protein